MDIETIIQYIAGASIRAIIFVYDDDKALVDPTSVLITWVDANEETQVSAEDIVVSGRIEKGIFEHYCNTTSGSATGWWKGTIRVVDGTGATARASMAKCSVNVT